mmetsp:Transcript_23215/g.30051  ORF Transcript_23215/g.30051 Transcript_23215/m.30051 type:complete len:84 (-) Transcript_23215:272-523(-)
MNCQKEETSFVAATSVLVWQFLPREEKVTFLRSIRKRLQPNDYLFLVEVSISSQEEYNLYRNAFLLHGQAVDLDKQSRYGKGH